MPLYCKAYFLQYSHLAANKRMPMSYAHKRAIALLVCLVLLLVWPERSTSNISHLPSNQNATTQQHQKSNTETIQDRHLATEEAVAYYNKWLMFFTAMLALATLGLGFATVLVSNQ
jgi:hypothetical protein